MKNTIKELLEALLKGKIICFHKKFGIENELRGGRR